MLSGVMSAAKKVLEEALALPADERRRIAKLLLESVPQASTETAEAIEDAWVAEAVRRADEVERGDAEVLDGESALRRLEAKLRSGST